MYKKILFWGSVTIAVLLVLFIVILNIISSTLNSPDYAIKAYFEDLNVEYQIHRTDYNGRELRYVETGIQEDSIPLLFFIHGAPGSWDAFKEYLADYDLNRAFRLISMDRIGYGGSSLGKSESDLTIHADAALHILEKYNPSECIVISHSYGSPISAVMATRKPDKIQGLVMCSPVNDYISEPLKWYAKLANWKIVRCVMPAIVNVATDEKITHKTSLKNIEAIWSHVKCPVFHYHGNEDILAPYNGNVEWSHNYLKNAPLTVRTEEEAGHLLIWFKAETFKNIIIDFYRSI